MREGTWTVCTFLSVISQNVSRDFFYDIDREYQFLLGKFQLWSKNFFFCSNYLRFYYRRNQSIGIPSPRETRPFRSIHSRIFLYFNSLGFSDYHICRESYERALAWIRFFLSPFLSRPSSLSLYPVFVYFYFNKIKLANDEAHSRQTHAGCISARSPLQ